MTSAIHHINMYGCGGSEVLPDCTRITDTTTAYKMIGTALAEYTP